MKHTKKVIALLLTAVPVAKIVPRPPVSSSRYCVFKVDLSRGELTLSGGLPYSEGKRRMEKAFGLCYNGVAIFFVGWRAVREGEFFMMYRGLL